MNLKKVFIGVFISTFFLGITAYFLIPRLNQIAQKESVKESPKVMAEPKSEIVEESKVPKENLEILEENKDWENRDESRFKTRLIETGDGFHGDEIEAKSGETWLGLFKKGNDFFLKNTKLKVRRVHDSIVDGERKINTGKSVFSREKSQAVYLLKNAKKLKEVKIKTLFYFDDDDREDYDDFFQFNIGVRKKFSIGENNFSIQVKKGINKKGEKIIALILSDGKINQTLHSLKYFGEDDYMGSLVWVGDLDNDGKPDFYLDLYFHDNVEYKNLFLSSEAEKGKLVKKVAVFSITGC